MLDRILSSFGVVVYHCDETGLAYTAYNGRIPTQEEIDLTYDHDREFLREAPE